MKTQDKLLIAMGINIIFMLISVISVVFFDFKIPQLKSWQMCLASAPFILFFVLFTIYDYLIKDDDD